MTTKTKTAQATSAPTWSDRARQALTDGEDYPPITPISALGDCISYLRRPSVIAALKADNIIDDEESYIEVVGWVERMQDKLRSLIDEPDDSVSKERLDAALNALEGLIRIAPENWADDGDVDAERAWLVANDVIDAEGRKARLPKPLPLESLQ